MDLKTESTSTCKKRKSNSRSYLQVEGYYHDPKIGNSTFWIENQGETESDIEGNIAQVQQLLDGKGAFCKTLEFRDNTLVRVSPKKPNSSIKFHSLDKLKSKIEDGSREMDVVKAISKDIKLLQVGTPKPQKSHHEYIYAEKLNQDRNYKSRGKHNGHISHEILENSTDQSIWTPKKPTFQIGIEGVTAQQKKIAQVQQLLEDMRRYIEETENSFYAHLEKERKCRFEKIIEKYEKDTREAVIDPPTMTISTKPGKWAQLRNRHLNPTPQCMSNTTASILKELQSLYKEEDRLRLDLKKEKRLFSKLSSNCTNEDSPNKTNRFVDKFIPIDGDFPQDSLFASDTNKTPVKLHSVPSNSKSFLNQTNLLEAERASDSDDDRVTLSLPSFDDLTTSQQSGGLKYSIK